MTQPPFAKIHSTTVRLENTLKALEIGERKSYAELSAVAGVDVTPMQRSKGFGYLRRAILRCIRQGIPIINVRCYGYMRAAPEDHMDALLCRRENLHSAANRSKYLAECLPVSELPPDKQFKAVAITSHLRLMSYMSNSRVLTRIGTTVKSIADRPSNTTLIKILAKKNPVE